jgi:TPP-dependent pyruvate/acetoin dehydrogenase alpha subunit
LISNKKLIDLYAAMVRCRLIGERVAPPVKPMAPTIAAAGWEATLAGVAADLVPEDSLFHAHTSFARVLTHVPLQELFTGIASNGNGHAHPVVKPTPHGAAQRHSPTSDELDAACAAAKTHKASKNGKVAVTFYESAQANQRSWGKSLRLASRHSLPVLFICHAAVQEEIHHGAATSQRTPEALAFGVPVIRVDSNDVVAVYRVASESIARARQRRGPTVIASAPGHLFDPLEKGILVSRQPNRHDPLLTMEAYLRSKGLFDSKLKQKIERRFQQELIPATSFLNK